MPRLGPDGQQVKINGVPQWDNTYSLIDKNAKTTLTDDNGQPKQWIKDAVSWGLPGYPQSLVTSKLANGTEIPATIAGRALHQLVMLNTLQSELNSFADSFGKDKNGKPVVAKMDIKSAIQNDPRLLNAIQHFQRAAGVSTDPTEQLAAMKADKSAAPYAAQIANLFGSENLQNYATDKKAKAEAQVSAAKTSAEKAAALPFDVAKETRVNAAKDDRDEARQSAKDARVSVYALDPQTHELVFTNRADAEAKGMDGIEEVKAGDIQKDRAALRQLNDVQMNVSRYTGAANAALKARPTAADIANMHSILNKAGIADLNVAISEGGHVTIPLVSSVLEGMSRQEKSDAYRLLSPQAKALMDGYIRSLSAVPAYQKALTGIGRSNKEMLDLELANIPSPTMEPEDIQRKLSQFQENVDRASEGFPKLPGIQHPREVKAQYERQYQTLPPVNFPLPKPMPPVQQ